MSSGCDLTFGGGLNNPFAWKALKFKFKFVYDKESCFLHGKLFEFGIRAVVVLYKGKVNTLGYFTL